MRKFLSAAVAIIVALSILSTCKKNGEPNAPEGEIAVSKLRVKINEPDSMLLVGADTNKTVSWTVTPAGSDELRVFKTAAFINFSKAGSYTIKASNSDIQASPITITVIDSVYEPPSLYIHFTAGEQIYFTPGIIKNVGSDSSYLAFTATTKNAYCNHSQLECGVYFSTTEYYLAFNGVQLLSADGCAPGSHTLTRNFDFRSYVTPLKEGIYPLHMLFKDVSTNGSIEVTATQVIFHWDDASGVIISPKVLAR